MKTIAKILIVETAALFCLCACTEKTTFDLGDITGDWYYSIADDRVSEDGSISYTFLPNGSCQVVSSNYLDSSVESDHFSIGKWSLSGNILTIDIEGVDDWILTKKGKDKILCQGRYHDCQYFLIRQKGKSYNEIKGSWNGEKSVTMTDNEGVQSEHTAMIGLIFSDDRNCKMMSGIRDLYSANVINYNCFWYPAGSSFDLVDSDMHRDYTGRLDKGTITLKRISDDEVFTLTKLLLE